MPRELDTEATRKERFAVVTRRVWIAVWKIVLPGAILGVVFMLLGEATKPHIDVIPALLAELGTGFIVACIAVFGYEYLRDVSGVIEEQDEFRRQVALFKEINERAADQALSDDLLRVLNHPKLTGELVATVQQAIDINARSRLVHASPGMASAAGLEPIILHSDACLNLLADLTHDSLTFAQTLNQFHEDVSNRYVAPGGRDYSLPDPREVAGKVLSMLLSSLESGDYYKSVANVLFYEHTLMAMFEHAAAAACDRGVVIQRLFNVSNFEEGALGMQRFQVCKNIIRAHQFLQKRIEARHPGGYQIRFYGSALGAFVHEQFNPVNCPHLAELPQAYFGLFCKKTQNANLLFFAREPQRASRVWLAFRDQSDPSEAYFDQMWTVAAAAPNPFAGERFDPGWLASTVAQLNHHASDQGEAAGI